MNNNEKVQSIFDTSYIGNLFQRVRLWNQFRDNLKPNDINGFRMLAEELFELAAYDRQPAKDLAALITEDVFAEYEKRRPMFDSGFGFSDSDIIDALGDIVFIAIGEIYKRGYDAENVLKRICDANDQKGINKDQNGKIIKDGNFQEPQHTRAV